MDRHKKSTRQTTQQRQWITCAHQQSSQEAMVVVEVWLALGVQLEE
jgi:hypothetical protein